MWSTTAAVATALFMAGSSRAAPQPVSVVGNGGVPRVLVFTRTMGYRHDSIPVAIDTLGSTGPSYGVSFDFTEDPSYFVDDTLKEYDGVMFVSNSEEILEADGQAALARYFQSGGVYTGVHAASACLFNDTNYLNVVGAYFDFHPSLQNATFVPTTRDHPATADVPDQWRFEEEVYHFRSDPRTLGAQVILTVDEDSYNHDASSAFDFPFQGDPHPIAWYIEEPQSAQPLADGAPKAGRSFYTSLGHSNSTWRDETFIEHVMNGLTWALDGASTRAYGVGLVGNQTAATNSSSNASASAGPSGSAAGSASGRANVQATGSGIPSGSATASGPSTATSPAGSTSSASRVVPALAAVLTALVFVAL